MNRPDTPHWPLDKAFGAIKKSVAKFLGIKRLKAGRDFADSAVTMAPLAGKREYNMGDLWREPPDNQSTAEGEPPHPHAPRPLR